MNGEQGPTYKDACLALDLLEDDNHWEYWLAEEVLGCTTLHVCYSVYYMFPERADTLWDKHKDSIKIYCIEFVQGTTI